MFPAHVMLEGIDLLPILPEALTRISTIVKDNSATTEEFAQAAMTDPVLTACMLHAANSLSADNTKSFKTIHDAVEQFGMQTLYDAAIGSTIRRSLPARIPGYGISADKYWVHCIAVATIADRLARKFELPNADMAFTAGLLHDIGQIVIGNFLGHAMPAANWWTFDTPAKERDLLGCNHCDVGYEIAVKWNLPKTVRDSCRWHHELTNASEDLDTNMITIINAADALAYMIGFPGVGYVGEVLDKETPVRLGLGTKELYQMAIELKQTIAQNAAASGMTVHLDEESSDGYSKSIYTPPSG
jgi:putative nucleotidyltransferase with HDIG domain